MGKRVEVDRFKILLFRLFRLMVSDISILVIVVMNGSLCVLYIAKKDLVSSQA